MSRTSSSQDLRLHHHVERGRRLVGEQHLRVAGERHRDRRALAHAAGELVRDSGRRARREMPDQLEQLGRPRPRGACRVATPCSSIGSTIWTPTVFTGLNAFIAPWKTIAMSCQRCGATVSSPRARMSSPSSSTRPATLALARQQAHQRQDGRRLAAARLADEAHPLARAQARSSTPCTACSSPPPRGRTTRAGPRRSSTAARAHSESSLAPRAAAAGSGAPTGGRPAAAG